MASRGTGRGSAPGVGRGLPIAQMSNVSIHIPRGTGRGIIGSVLHTSTATVSSATGPVDRRGENFSKDRPTYRVPKRFHKFARTKADIGSKQGTGGKTVQLYTNYFSMLPRGQEQDAEYMLTMFHVTFEPFVERRLERNDLVSRALAILENVGYFYDGMANIFLAASKCDEHNAIKKLCKSEIALPYGDRETRDLKFEFIMNVGALRDKVFDHMDMANGVLNQQMAGNLVKQGLYRMGDGFYNEQAAVKIPGLNLTFGLYMWPGYIPTIMRYDGGLMANVDLSSKFIRDGTVFDFLVLLNRGKIPLPDSPDFIGMANDLLRHMVVLTRYNRRTYKVESVSDKQSVDTTFKWIQSTITETSKSAAKEKDITVREYLKAMHNITVCHEKQPMLMCLPVDSDEKRRKINGELQTIPLVPELCTLVGLTNDMRTNQFSMTKILDAVRKEPGKRVHLLKEFAQTFGKDTKESLEKWNLEMGLDLETVNGRELPVSKLEQGGKSVSYDRKEADWSRNMRSGCLDSPQNIAEWAIVFPASAENDAGQLYKWIMTVSKPFGIQFPAPKLCPLTADKFKEELEKLPATCSIVLIVLPTNDSGRYREIKKYLVCERGMPSQCILTKNAAKNMSIATKLVLQMNAKLGGALWHIKEPSVKLTGVMVVGVAKCRGWLSLVATLDARYSEYTGESGELKNGVEHAFKAGLDAALEQYRDRHGRYPATIILYRLLDTEEEIADLTGAFQPTNKRDRQLSEMECVKRAIRDVGLVSNLLYCVALKRCSTRFFNGESNYTNPAAGTIIDQKVTIPGRYDFFLISHCGRKGTVMPTYYFILEDNTKISVNDFQNFTYEMAHMYYNWSGTIKVPAVCQYAMKMATMCADVTKKGPKEVLRNKMWYL